MSCVRAPVDDATRVQEMEALRYRQCDVLPFVVPAEFRGPQPQLPAQRSAQISALHLLRQEASGTEWYNDT